MEKIVIMLDSVVEKCPEGTETVVQKAGEYWVKSCEMLTPLMQNVLNNL